MNIYFVNLLIQKIHEMWYPINIDKSTVYRHYKFQMPQMLLKKKIGHLVRTSDLPGSREPVQAAHPIRGGTAPTTDPTQVLRMVCLFMGV